MSNHEKLVLKNTLIAVLFVIALGLVIIPDYGTIGAAITFSAGLIAYNLLLVSACRKHLSLNTHISRSGIKNLFSKHSIHHIRSLVSSKKADDS